MEHSKDRGELGWKSLERVPGLQVANWVVATQAFAMFTRKIGEDSHFDEDFSNGVGSTTTPGIRQTKHIRAGDHCLGAGRYQMQHVRVEDRWTESGML